MNKTPWIQAAIDVESIEVAKKIAFMALDAGADWLEVGTPLLYQYGHAAIGMIRKAVGKNAILVADYKTSFSELCAEQAKREGADFLLLSAGYHARMTERSLQYARQLEIEPIFDLAVRPDDMGEYARMYAKMGVKYLFSRHYSDMRGEKIDNIAKILAGEKTFYLGITSDDFSEALDAVRGGADWITFGVVLRKPDAAVCKQWIDGIRFAKN